MARERTRKPSPSSDRTEPAEPARGLTPKQAAFVREYLVDSNGKQAAIRAGYTELSAEVTASKLLRNPKVRESVEAGKAVVAERAEVEAVEVLRELKRIGFSDPGRVLDADGALLPLHKMPEDIRRAIASVEVEDLFAGKGEERVQVGTLTKVKFWDKPKSLELLGKYLKLFTDKVELGGELKLTHEDALGALE
ncbi:terminase small subunit [Pyxidicoccus caerfyrddinensis]|uniref:terminase small subunit n=1 Tax=Pyxidicoccus caerfyrddinensis TaxID=2709663 RepID=UPI0013D9B292|nr:terminase small subunit [Pyxidicoccus caerfyrddinensis]